MSAKASDNRIYNNSLAVRKKTSKKYPVTATATISINAKKNASDGNNAL